MKLSLVFLSLCLLTYSHSEDHWKEQLRNRIARAPETNIFFWPSFNWRRTTTTRIPTTKSSLTTTTISTATATATVGSSSSFTAFQNEALAQTNKYRATHCAPNLILSSTLNSIAQTYANKLASIRQLMHSSNGYGENLYYTGSSQAIDISSVKGSTPVDDWYNEVKQYNWSSPGFSSSTGHFTQTVWASTQQLGIGIACTSERKECYIVANYSPAGNSQGQYQSNVKKGSPCS